MTGLQELEKLRAHYRRAHLAQLDTEDALTLRERIERDPEIGKGRR